MAGVGDNSSMQQPTNNQNGTIRGSGTGKCEAEAPAETRGGGAEAPADRRQWCNKRQHNNQPEDKRDVARGGGAMRGGG
jgi:hypothetical protein